MPLQLRDHYLSQSSHLQQQADDSSRLINILLYFALPYGILLIVSFLFHSRSVQAQMAMPLWPFPSTGAQKLIYYVVVAALGAIGLYVVIGNYWGNSSWLLYAIGCALLAAYVFIYTLTSRFTFFLTTIVAVLLAVDMQWLFIQTAKMAQNGISDEIIRNLVGGVGAWAIIYALLTLGQLLVSFGFNRKCQAILYFITAVVAIGLIGYWNRSNYATWINLIGFFGVGVFLILFGLFNSHKNSSSDLENLL